MSRRYPFDALASAMRMSPNAAAVTLGVGGSTLQDYRRRGVTERVADRLAVRAGMHPSDVWPEWLDDGIADAQRACDECGEQFWPVSRVHRFCTRACYRRYHARHTARRRRQRPEVAERENARRRAYYAENGAYERARERRRYHASKTEEGTTR